MTIKPVKTTWGMTTELVQEDVNQLLYSWIQKWPAKGGQFFGLQVTKPFDSFSKRVGSNCVEQAYPAARTPTECREEVFEMTVNKHFKSSCELLRLNLILMLTSCWWIDFVQSVCKLFAISLLYKCTQNHIMFALLELLLRS